MNHIRFRIYKIRHFVGGVCVWPVLFIAPITTLVLGFLCSIPLIGLPFLLLISFLWLCIFAGLMVLSYLQKWLPALLPIVAIVGVPFSVAGEMIVSMLPSMGENDAKGSKLLLLDAYPFSIETLRFLHNGEECSSEFSSVLDDFSKNEIAFEDRLVKSIRARAAEV